VAQVDQADDLSRLLLRAYRTLTTSVLARVEADAPCGVRGSHVAMMAAIIGHAPTRMADVAATAGVTRQAAAAVIRELEALRLLTVRPDESDGRASLVELTASGIEYCARALEVVAEMEVELADALGDPQLQNLRATLAKLIAATGP